MFAGGDDDRRFAAPLEIARVVRMQLDGRGQQFQANTENQRKQDVWPHSGVAVVHGQSLGDFTVGCCFLLSDYRQDLASSPVHLIHSRTDKAAA